jgi:hypothetical protein
MSLDERYIVASDLESFFVDKDTGLPLANGTLTFYRDAARNVPKEVFQLSGSPPNYTYTSMGAQITLSAVGTVQNSGGDNEVIYYFPFDTQGNLDLYYVDVRNQNGIQQFTREAWPNVTSGNDPSKDASGLQNQISNTTFTNSFLNEGITTTFSVSSASNQVFELAPNWDFVISGTGTVIVERIPVSGNEKVPTSPPYVLDVQVSLGITACYLRQRFLYNSGLWASTPNSPLFLAGSYVARSESVGTTGIQMFYSNSGGSTPILIVDGSFQSAYQLISGSTANQIPASTDTNTGINGYVDIYLSFITGSHVRVSSIQVIPTASSTINLVHYDVDSSNRNEAYQGDYYIPRSAAKRIPSYLVAWDFAVAQFQFGASGSLSTSAAYISDQTISQRQSAGTITWLDAANVTGGLEFTCSGTNNSFYILQYLTAERAKQLVQNRLSVNVFGYQNTGPTDKATARIYLFRGGSTASIPTLPTTIATLNVDGTLTLTGANWTLMPRSGLDVPTFKLNQVDNTNVFDPANDVGFSGWQLTDSGQLEDTDKFAIFVTFAYPDDGTTIVVNSVSLVPGDLPCRPGIQSPDEILRECQFYYESSYQVGTPPGTITSAGALTQNFHVQFDAGLDILYAKTFTTSFKNIKLADPIVTFYATTSGTPNLLRAVIREPGVAVADALAAIGSFWTPTNQGIYSYVLQASTPTAIVSKTFALADEGYYEYHFVADCRLGIV